jgi:hypothetical protein
MRTVQASIKTDRICNRARDQCASAVRSAVSFHGLIFASVFARLAFATSVS